jgi:hypothetical protein
MILNLCFEVPEYRSNETVHAASFLNLLLHNQLTKIVSISAQLLVSSNLINRLNNYFVLDLADFHMNEIKQYLIGRCWNYAI